MPRLLIHFSLLAAVGGVFGTARADIIQLAHNEELIVVFGVAGFNSSNLSTIYPTTIGLELAGSVPGGSATAGIPGSTAQYYSGILLAGSLRSLDGRMSLPLFDADSWRLGLPTGNLVADASAGGGAITYADVVLGLNASAALFGNTGQAEFVIQNIGSDLTIGLGAGYSLSNAVLVPLSAGNGSVQTAGYLVSLQKVPFGIQPLSLGTTAVPEPAALGVVVCGGVLLFWLRRRIKPVQR